MSRKILKNLFVISVGVLVVQAASAAILATVNEKSIEGKDLQSEYGQLNEMQKERVNKDLATRREMVESAVNAELLNQAAKQAGLDQDDDFKRAAERFRKQYLATRYMQKNIEGKLSKESIREYFEKNKTKYDSTQIHAFHILLKTEEEANRVLAQAQAAKTDKDFSKLAKEHSLDPTVQENGGDLGYFTRDRMVPEFAAASFAMKKGETKGPIRSYFGYHIIRVVDAKPGRIPNFDEVETRVREDLRAHLARTMLLDLRQKATIKVNEDALNGFKL